jgi:putative spermidine/putrescine transport system permease protein
MRQLFQRRTILLLVLPALIVLTLFFIFPIIFVLVDSVRTPNNTLTFARYVSFLTDSDTSRVYWRTLELGLIVTALAAILSYPTAYLMARMTPGRRAFMMSLVILPLLTNPVARTYAWLIILGRNGLINEFLQAIGIITEPLRLIFTENAIVVGLLQLFMPLMVLALVSAMENIPSDVEEAARSLGANGLQTFLRVIMPLSADGLVLGGTLVFTGSITAYVTPAILGGTRVLMLATLLQQRAIVLLDWEGATIIAVVMITTTLVINAILRTLRPKMT